MTTKRSAPRGERGPRARPPFRARTLPPPPAASTIFRGEPAEGVRRENAQSARAISRDAAGHILINGGAVRVAGGTPTVANTTLIQVFGQGGNDQISLDETNGALPAANLFGGAGNDTLTGGSAATTCSSARAATTRSTARAATTSCSAATAMTC